MYLLLEEVTNIFTFNTVLNDLRIIICLRKSKLLLKQAQFVMTVIIKLIGMAYTVCHAPISTTS